MSFYYSLFILLFSAIHENSPQKFIRPSNFVQSIENPYPNIAAIPLPEGYKRLPADGGSFAAWLRQLPLKKNKTVYLYNSMPKANQASQFAVIDISTGNKDLQQCADAVMRLRAEYLYGQKRYTAIDFTDNNRNHYRLPAGASRPVFNQYLEKVFAWCGTASLEKQLMPVADKRQLAAGDVLIKGGSPGHAMMVMDIAENNAGEKIFLLAQSYMPAQDMHIVLNPQNKRLSPWYQANGKLLIETPEWDFKMPCLRKWPTN